MLLDDLALLDLRLGSLDLGDGVQIDGHPLVGVRVFAIDGESALHHGEGALQRRQPGRVGG